MASNSWFVVVIDPVVDLISKSIYATRKMKISIFYPFTIIPAKAITSAKY